MHCGYTPVFRARRPRDALPAEPGVPLRNRAGAPLGVAAAGLASGHIFFTDICIIPALRVKLYFS